MLTHLYMWNVFTCYSYCCASIYLGKSLTFVALSYNTSLAPEYQMTEFLSGSYKEKQQENLNQEKFFGKQ